ncbi:helix-turn-helix transcriptional regulator [Clostridium sp.]|uniref:helix-turn-helix transcriptional regulator n=1 Tax=Clostridium sp. TaxID=1506 RepID=UPI00399435D2
MNISKLKVERVKQGLTQGELADLSNVNVNAIVRLEKGQLEKARFGTLIKVSRALGKSIQELFLDEEER